jgi:phosphatidylserine decarboxylase
LKHYPHPILAREGWPFIIIAVLASLLLWYLADFWWALPIILATIFIIQFFRDPKRMIPSAANVVISPADGRVICVQECQDEYQNIPALKVSIFMNVFNVHSNRSPVDGEIVDLQYFAGKFINADFDKASTENERNAMVMKLVNGQKITVVQVAGLIARRILCYAKVGDSLARGQRYGFIRFGSRVDVFLPLNAKVLVTIGQKVKATETILATLED